MAHRVEIVRLLSAIAVGFGACLFVSYYSRASRLDYEQTFGRSIPLPPLPFFTRCVFDYSGYAYLIPALVLCIGIALLRRREPELMLEMAVGFAWIAALAWVLFAVWAWRIAMIKYV